MRHDPGGVYCTVDSSRLLRQPIPHPEIHELKIVPFPAGSSVVTATFRFTSLRASEMSPKETP